MIWYIDRNAAGQITLSFPLPTVQFKPAPELPPVTFTQGEFTVIFPDDDDARMVVQMLQDMTEEDDEAGYMIDLRDP